MIGRRFGDFEITAEIGKGGMGKVYKARQISLDRDVAIKVLPVELSTVEEFAERFDLEAKAVASLIHPNIIQMYSKGVTSEGINYFAMEYVDGEDLAQKLKRGLQFSEPEAIDLVIQVTLGLESAWKKNIIHRDIKPSNLIMTADGTVKIADFGLAKSLDATKKLTRTDVYIGTVSYTSPEQGEGKPVDHRTDIYSLGIVLYQLLTNRVPFEGETPSSVIYKHVHEPPVPPRQVNPALSPEIEAVVLKAIAKRPEDRFQNVVEFRKALEGVRKLRTAPEAAATARERGIAPALGSAGKASVAGRRSAIIIAVLLVLLTGGVGVYAYRQFVAAQKPVEVQEGAGAPTTEGVRPPAAPVAQPTQYPAIDGTGSQARGTDSTSPAGETAAPSIPQRADQPRTAPIAPVDIGVKKARPRDAGDTGGTRGATDIASYDRQKPVQRSSVPTVLIVARGEPDVSAVVEATIGRKLHAHALPMLGVEEVASVAERYGRYGIPLNALELPALKAQVLIYVTVDTVATEPLRFAGRYMDQYASTITVKIIDMATKSLIGSAKTRTVRHTTLNMQDNVEEATGQMTSDLPNSIDEFWKKG
ncbi:MAG: serine/threonine protein kinase [Chloroflexota bacterium]